jgi:hypothetical protein
MAEINDNEEYPAGAIIGDQCLRSPFLVPAKELHQRIAKKAYELYVRRGKKPGRDLDDWLEAERLLLSELSS